MNAGALRILEVLEPGGGGSGRHFVDLCAGLHARGHHVTAIYSPTRAEQRFVDELLAIGLARVHAVPMTRSPSPSDIRAWLRLRAIIRHDGPFDVIHGHSSKAGALVRFRLPGRHIPRVYTPHAFRTMDPLIPASGRRLYGTIESVLGRAFTDALICVSADEYRYARDALKIPEDLLVTIVNGAAPPPSGRRKEIRERMGVAEDAFVFGYVGRLAAQKAPERLVAAFARIARDHPAAEVVMIGSGPQRDELVAMIGRHGLSGRIHLVSDLPGAEAMQAFDVLVMPSRYEAMSYVMLEAAAAGLPQILTDVGGASTVLEDGVNGYLVANTDDPALLAGAMTRMMESEVYARLRSNAELRRGRHRLERMIDETEALYRALAAG